MKTMLVLLCCLLATLQSRPAPGEWGSVGKTKAHDFQVSTGRDQVSDEGRPLVWHRQVPRPDTKEGRASRERIVETLGPLAGEEKAARFAYLAVLKEYDCDRGRARGERMVYYGEDGAVLLVVTRGMMEGKGLTEWSYAPPESMDADLLNRACLKSRGEVY